MTEPKNNENEGEGNRTAARHYEEGTHEFIKSGQVEQRAEEAKRALEGDDAKDLTEAEARGRERAKEEDPALHRDYGKPN